MMSGAVPVALPHDPTTLAVWDVVDQQTVRVTFSDPEVSDGIPVPVEAELSSTVAVIVADLDEPMQILAQLARRAGISVHVTALCGDKRPGEVGVVNVTINGWRRFRAWFPQGLREAEPYIYRSFTGAKANDKASAVMFRLRALAHTALRQLPPNGLDVFVLRLE